MELHELNYLLFPGENPQPEWSQAYSATYRTWNQVWAETYREVDGISHLHSDDFTRQSLISSILWQGQCVAIGMFHLVDFNFPTAREDSWFRCWSDEDIEKLVADGKRVLVGSNVTVAPQHRGSLPNGLRFRNLMVSLMSRTLMDTNADVLAGTMRINKGMDKAGDLAGFTPIGTGIHHGEPAKLIGFFRKRMEKHPFDLAVESLWKRRQVYSHSNSLFGSATERAA